MNNKKVENIAPLYTKYETKTAKKRSFKQYLERIMKQVDEPAYDYDLVIPYEKLFYDTAWITHQIKQTFGIDITTPWLETYRRDYEAYHQSA